MAQHGMKRFLGKVALITGSTYGIGFSIAQRLASEGAKVIICSRKEANVQEATKKLTDMGYEAKGVTCHVAKEDERKELVEQARQFGGLDIMVFNAGVNPAIMGILDCPESAWDKAFDVNVKAPYLLTKEALPLLKKSKSGRIIYMSSLSVFFTMEQLGVYGVSKTALLGLTKAAAVQLGRDNITVNCVVPGVIDTRFSKIMVADEESTNEYFSNVPLKRIGTIEEVSGTVAFLASDDASYITGENIVIGGGKPSRL